MAGKTKKSGENVTINKQALLKLIKKGKKSGSLSFAEINESISDDIRSYDEIEDVVMEIQASGIELVDLEKERIRKEKKKPSAQTETVKKTVTKTVTKKTAAQKSKGKEKTGDKKEKTAKDLSSTKKDKTEA